MSEALVERIIEVTKDTKSTAFWRKAINQLGELPVEEELGEVKYQIHTGRIKDPAKYLTTLLKKRITKLPKGQQVAPTKLIQTYLNPNQMDLLQELQPLPQVKGELKEKKEMNQPFSDKQIPWATFVGPDFFTLSTNKQRKDMVIAKFRTLDGEVSTIPLIRGAYFPTDKPRGILTAEHGRVLGGIENIWAQQGCNYTQTQKGAVACYCTVKIRDLAKLLGWKTFCGQGLNHLKEMVIDLKMMPYYLDLEAVEEFQLAKIKGFGFTILGDAVLVNKQDNRRLETIIRVEFSDPYSRQLLARRVITRSKELITTKSDLAFLTHLYIEPILIRHGKFHKNLKDLITDLNLPKVGWHDRPGARKQQFRKVVKELNNKTTGINYKISLKIVKGLFDYVLEASLIDTTTGEIAGEEDKM